MSNKPNLNDGTTTTTTSVSVTRAPSEVMIGATSPEASEYLGSGSGGGPTTPYLGAFSVTCGGGSAGDVTVNFTLGGTAVGGDGNDFTITTSAGFSVDYEGDSGTITMAGDGPATAIIYVTPNDLGLTSGSKTVILTLTSGTGYSVVSGWSSATVNINDDDPPVDPPTGAATPQITAFNTAGSTVSSASAAVGDFIPIAIWVSSGDPYSVKIGLNYSSTLSVSLTPGGEKIGGSATPGGSAAIEYEPGSYLVLYATAADPTDDEANGTEVCGDIELVWQSGGTSSFTSTSTHVDFKPLQMFNNGTQIAGSTTSGYQNVKVGQLMSLQVKDPSAVGGIVKWTTPGGTTVKNYQPTTGPNGAAVKACKPSYLGPLDLLAMANGGNLSQQVLSSGSQQGLSFAWVVGGTGAPSSPMPSYVETATLYSPFGVAQAQAIFKVSAPAVTGDVYVNSTSNEDGAGGFSLFDNFMGGAITLSDGIGGQGINFVAHPVFNLNANGNRDFSGSWVQIIKGSALSYQPDEGAGSFPKDGQGEFAALGNSLDGKFPYPFGDTFEATDSPGIEGLNAFFHEWFDGTGSCAGSYQMWYTVKPNDVGPSIWVPVMSYKWQFAFDYIWREGDKSVYNTEAPAPGKFTPTTAFPTWAPWYKGFPPRR